MKKILLSMIVLLVLLWSVSSVFARRGGQSRSTGRQSQQKRNVQNKNRSRSQQRRESVEKQAGKRKGEVKTERTRTRAIKGQAGTAVKRAGEAKGKALQKESSRGKGKSAENIARGKGHQQQTKAFERQMLHEEAKYRQRKARMERIRKLATRSGNKDILGRLNKLQAKEQQRYERNRNRIREKIRTIQQSGEKSQGKTLRKTVETSANKEKGKAQKVGTKAE